MGEPVWGWVAETVDNCLVRPLAGTDIEEAARPDGVVAEYSVALPKAYTATMAPLRHARVALVDRGMDPADAEGALRVSGSPDVTRPCPTLWDVALECGRAYG